MWAGVACGVYWFNLIQVTLTHGVCFDIFVYLYVLYLEHTKSNHTAGNGAGVKDAALGQGRIKTDAWNTWGCLHCVPVCMYIYSSRVSMYMYV